MKPVITQVLIAIIAVFVCRSAVSASNGCPSASGPKNLKLTAVGIESGSRWAVLTSGIDDKEEIFQERDIIAGCLRLTGVAPNSVVLEEIDSHESFRLYLNGTGGKSRALPPKEACFVRALEGAQSKKVSANVMRIYYPPRSNTSGLPRAVYMNDRGAELFGDEHALGVGQGAEVVYSDGKPRGLRLGANVLNSVLGGVGFIKGDILVSINATGVTSPADVGKLLRAAGNNPVELVYTDAANKGGFVTTYGMIKSVQ